VTLSAYAILVQVESVLKTQLDCRLKVDAISMLIRGGRADKEQEQEEETHPDLEVLYGEVRYARRMMQHTGTTVCSGCGQEHG
jgi:hypothetical protein